MPKLEPELKRIKSLGTLNIENPIRKFGINFQLADGKRTNVENLSTGMKLRHKKRKDLKPKAKPNGKKTN